MLENLQGKTHEVFTGVTLIKGTDVESFVERSSVTMKKLTFDEIKNYVLNYLPLDKAGAYGIQDRIVVESYSGSYSNIVGLPLEKLKVQLQKWSSL